MNTLATIVIPFWLWAPALCIGFAVLAIGLIALIGHQVVLMDVKMGRDVSTRLIGIACMAMVVVFFSLVGCVLVGAIVSYHGSDLEATRVEAPCP
jgi:hypothetical protein